MKKTALSLVLVLFTSAALFAQTDKPVLTNVVNDEANKASFKFAEETFSFGTIKQGDVFTHDFAFTNTGKEPLVISSAAGSCGCTVPTWPKDPIAPGAKAVVKVTFNSAGKMGMQDKTVTLQSNAKQSPMVIHLTGTVEKPAETTPKAVEPDKK